MDELKKYCVPYSSLRKLRVYITILMAAIVFVAFKTIRNVYLPFSEIIFNTASVLVAFVLGCVLYFLIKRKIFDKKLKLFESRVQYFKHHEVMAFVLRDFNTGERQLGGSIIVGQDCLIGSNTGMIALYDEIQRIYSIPNNSDNINQLFIDNLEGSKITLESLLKKSIALETCAFSVQIAILKSPL